MDPLDQKDSVDSLAQWDPKVTQAAKEAMENKAQEVFLVPRDQSENLVLLGMGVLLAIQDSGVG